MTKEGIIELASYEAISLTKYLDSVNVHTIGIGMTVSEIPDLNSWSWNKQLTIKECMDMYKKGLQKYVDAVNNALQVEVTPNQFDALVSLTYNIGIGAMRKSTFMKRLNAGYSPVSVVEAMKRFNRAGGRVIQGLVNRRNKEGDVFLYGKYLAKGSITKIDVNPNSHKPIYRGTINVEAYV